MGLISWTKGATTVSKALDDVLMNLNAELDKTDGLIDKMKCDIHAGPAGASVSVTLVVNGSEPKKKSVLGVNEKGVNREHSMRKATEKMNKLLEDIDGELVDVFVKTVVAPLPGRVYTTIIAAVNEYRLTQVLDSDMRRKRIKAALELFNNNPSALNLAGVAGIFGVSRTIIYKDLEAIGFRRGK